MAPVGMIILGLIVLLVVVAGAALLVKPVSVQSALLTCRIA